MFLNVAKGMDQVENYINHLTKGMRKHAQGNKVKARKLDLAPKSTTQGCYLFHIVNGQSDERMLDICYLWKQIDKLNVDESSWLDGIHLQILKVTQRWDLEIVDQCR